MYVMITQQNRKIYFQTLDDALDFLEKSKMKFHKIQPEKQSISSIT